MNKFIITLLIAFGFIIAVPQIAYVWHPVIEGTATCADVQGNFDVNWVVSSDTVRDSDWTIDAVTKPDSQSFTYTTHHNLSGGNPSLTKTAVWSNGETATATGYASKPSQCVVETTTTTMSSTTTSTVVSPTTTLVGPQLPPTGSTSGVLIFAALVLSIGTFLYILRIWMNRP